MFKQLKNYWPDVKSSILHQDRGGDCYVPERCADKFPFQKKKERKKTTASFWRVVMFWGYLHQCCIGKGLLIQGSPFRQSVSKRVFWKVNKIMASRSYRELRGFWMPGATDLLRCILNGVAVYVGILRRKVAPSALLFRILCGKQIIWGESRSRRPGRRLFQDAKWEIRVAWSRVIWQKASDSAFFLM